MTARWPALLFTTCLAAATLAADPAADWQAILALDAGPPGQARNVDEARTAALRHLAAQEQALRAFVKNHPRDAHTFEARLRLARLLEIRGGFEGSEKARVEARVLLAELEKIATPEQRVEIDFAKVTRLMRGAQRAPEDRRNEILSAARKFHSSHPGDRRVPRLLAEVATLFDHQPRVKISLLNDASALATDAGLKQRIADDLRRLDLLGQPVPLSFTSLQGKPVQLEDFRGQPVLIVFFADFSQPSTDALARLQRVVAEAPKNSVAAIGVSLDAKREELAALMTRTGLNWPVAFDGKSWEGELVRALGINALPTVWLCDKRGRLRSLNALDNAAELIRQLARE